MKHHKFVFKGAGKERALRYLRGESSPESAVRRDRHAADETEESPVVAAEGNAVRMIGSAAGLTDVGSVRPLNEDALLMAENVAGVADGMGGHQAGEVASANARDMLLAFLEGKTPCVANIEAGIKQVNSDLYAMQQEKPECAGMGTTLTVLWDSGEELILGHVGDSRAYRLRDGVLEQQTMDHSMVAEMVRQGILSPEDAEVHPMRNIITRAVATDSEVEVDTHVEERRVGDVWLLCTDGLHGMVSHDEIERILAAHAPAEAAQLLVEAALAAGGRDNVTLVIYPITEAPHE